MAHAVFLGLCAWLGVAWEQLGVAIYEISAGTRLATIITGRVRFSTENCHIYNLSTTDLVEQSKPNLHLHVK